VNTIDGKNGYNNKALLFHETSYWMTNRRKSIEFARPFN